MRRIVALLAFSSLVALGVVAVDGPAVRAEVPYPAGWGGDPSALKTAPGQMPNDLDLEEEYQYLSTASENPALHTAQQLGGVKGASIDRAWNTTTGRPDVLIAVHDSGVEWRNPDAMRDLRNKIHLNTGELPTPPSGNDDADGNGVVTVDDWAGAPGVTDRNGNGLLDPEDLILTYSDGVDDDGNGYVDDISGWDFLNGDNNPLDDVGYGHGTGELRDSTAEANNGGGRPGACPSCMSLPVRVGDSFITDGLRFAAGVLFSLDSGADVIQEALGALNDPQQAQLAIDAAYRRGVPIVASMADEASKHPNMPASLERTMPVNSVSKSEEDLQPEDYLALNGCTNYGGTTFVSVPSDSCSSEATGIGSGIMGLLQAAARNAADAGTIAPYPNLGGEGRNVLSAEEAYQVVRANVDDIDFSTPSAGAPANNFSVDSIINFARLTRRYPTTQGWDTTDGYGRINAQRIVEAVAAGDIPPEASIDTPRRLELAGASGTLAVTGSVAAVREPSYTWRVEWAAGSTPPLWPNTDIWHTAGAGSATAPFHGRLATLDLADDIAKALPDAAKGVPVERGKPDPERYSVRLRLVVETPGGRRGEQQKQIFVQDRAVRGLVAGTPKRLADGGGGPSPAFADLDGDGAEELLVATDAGRIHAYRNGAHDELPGWPVSGDPDPVWPTWSATATADKIPVGRGAFLIGAPVVDDLDGDGSPEIAAGDSAGRLYVWEADGSRRPGFPVSEDPRFSHGFERDEHNRMKPGFFAMPAAADLDGDGTKELVSTALDRHVYAWHADGIPVTGFPVLLIDPSKVSAVDPTTHEVTFKADSGVQLGGEITVPPAIGDLDGDGKPEIVVGAMEQYDETPNYFLPLGEGNGRVYAIHADGAAHPQSVDRVPAHPNEQAYVDGWPVKVGMILLDVLPFIGDGVAAQAAIADVHGDAKPEVLVSSPIGPLYVLDGGGRSVYGDLFGLPIVAGAFPGQLGWGRNTTDEPVYSGFGAPVAGRIGPGDRADYAMAVAGLGRGLDILLPHQQSPAEPGLMAWDGPTGQGLQGLPRVTSDLAFFVAPAIVDLDGDGHNEIIGGNGVYMLDAFDYRGATPKDWPKLTGGWLVGTPAAGDWDGDGDVELAAMRRDGVLLVYRTKGDVCSLTEWWRFGRDGTNAANRTVRVPARHGPLNAVDRVAAWKHLRNRR